MCTYTYADQFVHQSLWVLRFFHCEDRVQVLLKRYGEIEKIELARNIPSANRKDFKFVACDTQDAAVTYGERDSKVLCHTCY